MEFLSDKYYLIIKIHFFLIFHKIVVLKKIIKFKFCYSTVHDSLVFNCFPVLNFSFCFPNREVIKLETSFRKKKIGSLLSDQDWLLKMENKLPEVKFWYPRVVIYDPLKAGSIDGTDTEPHDKAIIRAMNAKYTPNYKVKGVAENTIFIARLSRKTTEQTLREEFSRFGKIIRCRLVRDIITNISRGYAFIEYETEKEAKKAVDRGDKTVIDDKMIFVDHECERLLPGWIPRRLGGGFGGKKESGQLRFGGKEKPFAKPIKLMEEYELRNQLNSKTFKT